MKKNLGSLDAASITDGSVVSSSSYGSLNHLICDSKINKNDNWKEFLSPKEAAQYLGVSDKFIYERIARGEIEAQPIGRLKRIRMSALEAWLSSQKERL